MVSQARWTIEDLEAFAADASRLIARDADASLVPLPGPLDSAEPAPAADWRSQAQQMHPQDQAVLARGWWDALKRPGEVVSFEVRQHTANGWMRFSCALVNLLEQPEFGCVLVKMTELGPCDPPRETVVPYHEPVWIIQYLGERGAILRTEGKVEQVFGRPAAEIAGNLVVDYLHPDDHAPAVSMWIEVLSAPGLTRAIRQRIVKPNGQVVWLESIVTNRLDDPSEPAVVAVSTDITDRLRQETELQRREQHFRDLAEGVPVGVFLADVEGQITYANERWHELTTEFGAQPGLFDLAGANESDFWMKWQDFVARGGDTWFEIQVTTPSAGKILRLRCHRRDPLGDVVGTIDDVTATVELTDELRRYAEMDPLTGVANRRGFERSLERALRDHRDNLALLFIDLDGFKKINDDFGHEVGDLVLTETARRLSRVVRPGDAVARYGGDEFVLVCMGVPPGEEGVIAARLDPIIGAPVRFAEGEVRPRASVGAVRPREGESVAALMRRADREMYARKRTPST